MSQAWKDHEVAMQEHWAKLDRPKATLPTCLEGEVAPGDTIELPDGQTLTVEGFDPVLDEIAQEPEPDCKYCTECGVVLEDSEDPDSSGLCDECFQFLEGNA